MKVKITTTGMNTHDCKVLIDDHDVTRNITDINVNIKAGCIPTLTLGFLSNDIEIDGDFEVLKNLKEKTNKDIIINIKGSKISIDDIGNEVLKKISQALNQM